VSAASGEKGRRAELGDVRESGEMFEYSDFGGRSRGLKGEIGVIACSDDKVVSSVWEYHDDVAEVRDMTWSCCLELSVLMLSSIPAEDTEGEVGESGEGISGSQNDSAGTGGVFLTRQSG
jgi:hypothetical protein